MSVAYFINNKSNFSNSNIDLEEFDCDICFNIKNNFVLTGHLFPFSANLNNFPFGSDVGRN